MLSEWRNGMWALSADFETNRLYYEYANKLDAYYAVVPSEPITVIKYASSELTAESDILAEELKSYMFEKLSNWCVGVGDVEKEWDAYLAELEAIGLSRFLEIQQAGWNN